MILIRSFQEPTLLIIVALISCIVYAIKRRTSRLRLPLPPGPRGWPLIGNVLQLGASYEWILYHEWCKEFNTEILHLNMAGSHVIVLENYEDCVELLEKRSSMYSGRPRMTMVNELMGWNFNFAWMNYGKRWRDHRRLMHDSFQPSALRSFQSIQLKMARRSLSRLMHTDNVLKEIRQLNGEIMLAVTYGIDAKPRNDPYIETAEKGGPPLSVAIAPGAFLVDALPFLKYIPEWMPGASFKCKAREWRAITEKIVNEPFEAFLLQMKDGIAKPSFLSDGFKVAAERGGIYNEENLKSVAGTVYQAGTDTTFTALSRCILALLDYPEAARRIQEEIDLVTSSTRLPDFNDELSFPYLMAFIKEVMRYSSFAPLGIAHFLVAEDEYKGYRMPAESIIIPNVWAMLHNEKVFPESWSFNPDRFLSGEKSKMVDAHARVIWGFGRRVCPGQNMAMASIWIVLAQILAIYDVLKAKDKDGNDIELSHDFPPSTLLIPRTLPCRFILRSKAAEQLLILSREESK